MEDFVFHNPTKVLFGRSILQLVGKETARLGSRVLLVSGRTSASVSGRLSVIRESLLAEGLSLVELTGIVPNPVVETVREGIEIARHENIEVICAVGGGSVIDSAKAIGTGVLANHDVWKLFTGKKPLRGTLPVVAIPTLAASGSEANSGMVLTNREKSLKLGYANRLLHPVTAIMDPSATFSVPKKHTAYGAIDALTHLMEFAFTATVAHAPIQERYMAGLAITIRESCETALADPCDYDARANLMWTAALALNGLSAAGLGKVGFPMHLIEHSLSALHDTAHGAGLAVIAPAWLRHQGSQLSPRAFRFLTALFPETPPTDAETAADLLTSWFAAIGAPTRLVDLGIGSKEIPILAANSQAQARSWRMREYDEGTVSRILELCQ